MTSLAAWGGLIVHFPWHIQVTLIILQLNNNLINIDIFVCDLC